jgi:ABC-type Fe3+-hydroxamate transport system substrate-binding protein
MRRCFYLSLLFLTLFMSAGQPRGRFISLSPSVTEIFFAIGAGDTLVGVASPANYPAEASRIETVASYEGILYEKIASLSPSGCFTVKGMQSGDSLQVLRRLNINVTEYPVSTLNELYECILDIGTKSGRQEEAARIVEGIKERIKGISASLPAQNKKALFLAGLDPIVAVGKGSYLNDLFRASRFKNVLEDVPPSYSVISYDTIVSLNPDWIILPEGEINGETKEDFVKKLALLKKEIKTGEVPADLVMRPGPRVAEGVSILAALRMGKSR